MVRIGSYIADFYCAQKQLVIELDGDVLAFQRIHVLRFTNREVMLHFNAVCAQIEDALATLAMP